MKIVNNVSDSFLYIIKDRKDFNEVVNEILLQVKPIRLRKQIANDFFLLIATKEQKTRHQVYEEIRNFIKSNTVICGDQATREDIITSSAYNECLNDLRKCLDQMEQGE